jgi:hypothetical protein
MTDTQIVKNSQSYPIKSRRNYLLDKVVLLIGNDTAVLQNMIIQLAQKGADVALICQKMPAETLGRIRDKVESLGRRFLLIEESRQQSVSPKWLIESVSSHLGHLDIFIDLSALKETPSSALTPNENDPSGNWFQLHWPLTQAAIQEIAQA